MTAKGRAKESSAARKTKPAQRALTQSAGHGPSVTPGIALRDSVRESPRVVAQRQQSHAAFGAALQSNAPVQLAGDPVVMDNRITPEWVVEHLADLQAGRDLSVGGFTLTANNTVANFQISGAQIQYSPAFAVGQSAPGLYFVLLHELAHNQHAHTGGSGLGSVENEMQADYTALLTAVTHTLASGAGIDAGVAGAEIFDRWLSSGNRGGGTHPLNDARIERLRRLINTITTTAEVVLSAHTTLAEDVWKANEGDLRAIGVEQKDVTETMATGTTPAQVEIDVNVRWTYGEYLAWRAGALPLMTTAAWGLLGLRAQWAVTPQAAYQSNREQLTLEDDVELITQGVAEAL